MRNRAQRSIVGLAAVLGFALSVAPPCRAACGQTADITGVLAGLRGLEFDEFVDASYRQILLRSPQLVTGLGLSAELGIRDNHLDSVCNACVDETYRLMAGIDDILDTYERSALSYEQQITFDSYNWVLAGWAVEHEFMYHFYPVHHGFSRQNELFRFMEDDHPLRTIPNIEDYISRLDEIDDQLACVIHNLDDSEARGIVAPAQMLQQAANQIRGIVPGSARYLPFYTSLFNKTLVMPGLSTTQREQYLAQAESVLAASVIPAFQALVARLDRQIPHAPPMDGVWRLPDGDRFYAARLRHHATCDLTPAEIHQLGLSEVARIRGEIRAAFNALGYPAGIGFAGGFERVAQDSGIVPANEVLPLVEGFIRQAKEDLLEAFDIAPHADVILIGVAQGEYYVSGSLDGSRPGAYYISNQSARPRYSMRTTAYHETLPGHHFQIALGNELDVPLFTKGGDFYTGFVEGWALYAEQLVEELGWYEGDVYAAIGRRQLELLRAARLVVDTGMHHYRWSRQQAIDYFINEVGYGSQAASSQIDMYLYNCGYFSSYKIGMMKILELREHAREELGERFDIKAFHRAVLMHNRLPLPLLERLVEDYIDAGRRKAPRPPRRVIRAGGMR